MLHKFTPYISRMIHVQISQILIFSDDSLTSEQEKAEKSITNNALLRKICYLNRVRLLLRIIWGSIVIVSSTSSLFASA